MTTNYRLWRREQFLIAFMFNNKFRSVVDEERLDYLSISSAESGTARTLSNDKSVQEYDVIKFWQEYFVKLAK